MSVQYKALPYLGFALAYRHADEKKNGEWSYEDRPHANVLLRGQVQRVIIENRNRFEWRYRPEVNNHMRYRNRTTLLLLRFPWPAPPSPPTPPWKCLLTPTPPTSTSSAPPPG